MRSSHLGVFKCAQADVLTHLASPHWSASPRCSMCVCGGGVDEPLYFFLSNGIVRVQSARDSEKQAVGWQGQVYWLRAKRWRAAHHREGPSFLRPGLLTASEGPRKQGLVLGWLPCLRPD